MADTNTVVHIGENSPEKIAYDLMRDVAKVEGKDLYKSNNNVGAVADRKWILDTYGECLAVVKNPYARE